MAVRIRPLVFNEVLWFQHLADVVKEGADADQQENGKAEGFVDRRPVARRAKRGHARRAQRFGQIHSFKCIGRCR